MMCSLSKFAKISILTIAIASNLCVNINAMELPKMIQQSTSTKTKIENMLHPQKETVHQSKNVDVTYLGKFKITGYCAEETCSEGYYKQTAWSGSKECVEGRTIAVDTNVIPYGSKVVMIINGEEQEFIAEDTGGAIIGNHIDVYHENHEDEHTYNGVDVYIIKQGDEK